ncbi:hypothetical protein ACFLZR_01585 [Candidatus Neomarinimicrobiota bacterium]
MTKHKVFFILALSSLLWAETSSEQRWEIKLENGRTYKNLGFDRLEGDQVFMFFYPLRTRFEGSRPVSVESIDTITPFTEPAPRYNVAVVNGAMLGLMLGIGVAFEYDWLGQYDPGRDKDRAPYILSGIILSSTLLGAYSGMHSTTQLGVEHITVVNTDAYHHYDFSGLAKEEKLIRMRQIMVAFGRPWRPVLQVR